MKERGNFHLNVALYTVSTVIETKIVTGWFKLQHWMWLAVELSDNKLSSELVGNRIYKSITIKECNFYDPASNRFITQRNPFPSFGLILLKFSCEEKFACSYCLHWPISPLPRNLHSGTRKLSKNYQFFKQNTIILIVLSLSLILLLSWHAGLDHSYLPKKPKEMGKFWRKYGMCYKRQITAK